MPDSQGHTPYAIPGRCPVRLIPALLRESACPNSRSYNQADSPERGCGADHRQQEQAARNVWFQIQITVLLHYSVPGVMIFLCVNLQDRDAELSGKAEQIRANARVGIRREQLDRFNSGP